MDKILLFFNKKKITFIPKIPKKITIIPKIPKTNESIFFTGACNT